MPQQKQPTPATNISQNGGDQDILSEATNRDNKDLKVWKQSKSHSKGD